MLRHYFAKKTPHLLHRVGFFHRSAVLGREVAVCENTLQQKTEFSQFLSDHKMFFNPKTGALVWNVMMQAKVTERNGTARANTAFAHTEEDWEYKARLRAILKTLAAELKTNPDISHIALQEGPINEYLDYFNLLVNAYFPPEWAVGEAHIEMDSTRWGVITLINRNKIQCSEVERIDLTSGISIKDIDVRCRTFALRNNDSNDGQLLTTLHLPHDNPADALRHFFTKVVESMLDASAEYPDIHDLLGDWNLDAAEVEAIILEVLESFADTVKRGHSKFINVSIYSSPEGHLKTSGKILGVDHAVRITSSPSNEYNYSVNQDFVKDMMSVVIACSIGGAGMMFTEKEGNLECFDEPSSFSVMPY